MHEKYKHLSALASYPEDMPNDEYPGEYMKPDLESTYIKGIHRVKKGRLFEATHKSRAYFTPPGAYDSRDSKINFEAHGERWADDVFGTGVEYPIDDMRCGIVWDKGTHTYALMLAVSFRSRNPRWQHLQIWTNVARMELQSNKWGNPGQTNYFANFRKESEYQDGKFPNAQIFNQEELRVQIMEQRKSDSKRTREDFMREAQAKEEPEVVMATLRSPEWIDTGGCRSGLFYSLRNFGAYYSLANCNQRVVFDLT